MTADVDANVSVNVSTIETEDKCGFVVNGREDLPTSASADCNGHKNDSAAVIEEPADGRSKSVGEVGSIDAEVDTGVAESVVDHGGSPMKHEVPVSDGKEEINGAVEVPNGCQGEIEAEQGEVNLNTVVEHSKESLISDLESDSESKSMEFSVNAAKDEENGIAGSTFTEESQVTSNAEIAEPEANHFGNVEREECCENVFELEQSKSREAEVISSIGIVESVEDQLGEAEIISCNNSNGSEESQPGDAEAMCSNNIAESERNLCGEVEVSRTGEAGGSELNQSKNTEDTTIEENQHSSIAFTEEVQDNNDVDLNHGEKPAGCDNNFSNGSQEASEGELSQNIEATSCVVGAGVELEAEEVSKVTLSEEYANGLSAGSAEDGVAESGVVDCISSAHKTTPLQNGGSEELGRTEILTSADADDSIKDSKKELGMDDTQLESGVSNGHVACQNGEALPADHGEECDSQEDISHPSQTLLENGSPSEVYGAVSTDNIAIAEHESIPVDPVSDTTLDVENGYSCSHDGALEPAVDNGHSHPIHDNETYEAGIERVDEKFKSSFGNDAIPETKANTITIKFGAFPAFSCDVTNIESKVPVLAANDAGNDLDREVCAHAIDVKADSEIENSLMLTREAPSDEGPASKSDLDSSAAAVKAESEVENSVIVPSVVPQDDGPFSESVSTENPVDVTTDSQCEVSAIRPGGIPHGDAPASEPLVLDGSGEGTHNDLQVENNDNQFRIHSGEKTANADNQAEASPSSPEGIDGQHLVAEGERRPFYMVKVPRYDYGENLREQIKRAQNQVDEKTKSRDIIRAEMQKQRACRNEFGALLEDAISEETVARDLFKAKRKEIDSVQVVINKMRGFRDLGEIDSKIRNMEHMLQHETLALKEEKNYIRMIQQLKQNREQVLSSLSKQEDVPEDSDQREQVEERLKILRKELDQLRDKVIKAEAATKIASKNFQDERAKMNDLTMQFRAADDVRQKAYADLQSLKEQSYDKSKYFREYKDDLKAAYDFLSKGDKNELQSHCVNQVERIMELWNNNDEFRQEYIRCNIRSTLRRLQTLDGRSLGPDEEPPVIPYMTERADRGQAPPATPLPEENTSAPLKKVEKKAEESIEKPVDQMKPTAKSKKPEKPAHYVNGFASEPQSREIEETPEPEKKLTKEEAELIRKAEEWRKVEEAAILREQKRMEEKAKAKEAMERKKRIADKAQARAAARAQKEAEKKEKEREKRARKKEKSKATEEVNEAEDVQDSAVPIEPVEKPIAQTKKPQKPTQFTKQLKPKSSMPLPLRNRGKRRMQTWMWALVAAVVILSIFLVSNANISLPRFGF